MGEETSYYELFNKACSFKPKSTVAEDLAKLIDNNCQPGVAALIKQTVQQALDAKVAEAVEKAKKDALSVVVANRVSIGSEDSELLVDSNKRRRTNAVVPSKDYQALAKSVKGKSKQDKTKLAELCAEAVKDIKEQMEQGQLLDGPFKNWAHRARDARDAVLSDIFGLQCASKRNPAREKMFAVFSTTGSHLHSRNRCRTDIVRRK